MCSSHFLFLIREAYNSLIFFFFTLEMAQKMSIRWKYAFRHSLQLDVHKKLSITSCAARYWERRLFNGAAGVWLGGIRLLTAISRLLGLVFHRAPCVFCGEMRGLGRDLLTHYRPSTSFRLQGSSGIWFRYACINLSPPPLCFFFLPLMSYVISHLSKSTDLG